MSDTAKETKEGGGFPAADIQEIQIKVHSNKLSTATKHLLPHLNELQTCCNMHLKHYKCQ